MIPALAVTRRDGHTSVFQPTTLAMWWAEETLGESFREANEWALRLALAYYDAHGQPDAAATLEQVRAWAKAESVNVEVADTAAGPTRPDPSGEP